jgi:hypothetical protein
VYLYPKSPCYEVLVGDLHIFSIISYELLYIRAARSSCGMLAVMYYLYVNKLVKIGVESMASSIAKCFLAPKPTSCAMSTVVACIQAVLHLANSLSTVSSRTYFTGWMTKDLTWYSVPS